MITLKGIYTDEELAGELEYVCRAMPYKGKFYNGICEPLEVKDGDVLMMLGQGTWYALYRRKTSENAQANASLRSGMSIKSNDKAQFRSEAT